MKNEKNVLIITEGKKTEPKLFKKLFAVFPDLGHYKIYTYNTNIYDLEQKLRPYFLNDEEEDIDVLSVLKENETDVNRLSILNNDYTDILLVFDFDPQDHRYDYTILRKMLCCFRESTDNGKLYLNYPMVESVRHFQSLPDYEFKERKVSLDTLMQGRYKELVSNESAVGNIGDFEIGTFKYIILENLKKANWIIHKMYFEPDIDELNTVLYDCAYEQNRLISDCKWCYVLNTGLFFLAEYNYNLLKT